MGNQDKLLSPLNQCQHLHLATDAIDTRVVETSTYLSVAMWRETNTTVLIVSHCVTPEPVYTIHSQRHNMKGISQSDHKPRKPSRP